MTVNEAIINALSEVAPCYPWGVEELNPESRDVRRIVFNYSTTPLVYGDNAPLLERYTVQVHYFCPYADDSIAARELIKALLFAADFDYPTEITVNDRTETEQHFCFETQISDFELIEGDEDGDA